jgi:DNA-binding HxlR family transcriptional regulator
MTTHGQYCPVFFAANVLGDRWTLLILREFVGGASRFNELERCLPKVSRTLLSQRLNHLTRIGLIEATPLPSGRGNAYRLTEAGAELEPILMAMGNWAVRWIIGEPREEELDPNFLMWWMHRRVKFDELPAKRTVVRFDLLSKQRDVFWLVLEPDEASICTSDPGIEVDVAVVADGMAMQRVFSGRITWRDALRDNKITITGPTRLTRQLPRWFAWSPFYDITREQLRSA